MRVVPVGGCGEFGRNATALAAGGDALLIDCGLQMPDDLSPGIDHFVPDLGGLLGRHPPQALFLTHGHEDHIGAVPHLLATLGRPLPVYGRPLTLALVEVALRAARVPRRLWDPRPLRPGDEVAVGALRVAALAVPHSIPEACALLARGPGGETVLHTGDLKLDGEPGALAALPAGGVDLLIGDSTNANRPGRSGSEDEVAAALAALCEQAPGRLVVALFSSHVARVAHFAASCARAGRRLCVLGRGLHEALAAAAATAVLRLPQTLLCTAEEAARLPPRQVALLCTGSQGEPEAALGRLVRAMPGADPDPPLAPAGRARHVALGPGDTVVLAARAIPGRELPLLRLEARLIEAGVHVLSGPPYAVSGHACAEELLAILGRVRPRALLPVHGAPRQLAAHAALAASLAIPALRCRDGDVIEVGPQVAVVDRLPAGRLSVEGRTTGQVGEETLRQRRLLGRSGLLVVVGRGAAGLSLQAIGVCDAGPELEALCDEARACAEAALLAGGWGEGGADERVRRAVRRVFHRARGVRPRVLVVAPTDAGR